MNSSRSLGEIPSGRRGIALVSVLVIVVLLTAVMLGFLATSKQEQVSSRSYKASSSARQLADTAINLVQGQINQATSQGMNYAWASQPGAIRVYDNTGVLFNIYKLYSAETLTTKDPAMMDVEASTDGGTTTPPGTNDMPPPTWATATAMWVDLNAPVNDAGGNPRFPIFDETLAATVDGFSVTGAPGATPAQPAPMPVRWLYVLQNGQIIAPDTTSTGTALTFSTAPVPPSAKNPIVGRIAFWTDDETCKVNINTAGGDGILNGTDPTDIANKTFWDVPHFTAPDDDSPTPSQPSLATSQPAQGEFQRYPGHPATVALNNILNGLGWTLNSTDFYSLLPRYTYGGSEGATVMVHVVGNGTAIPLKGSPANHLYSSVAEMLFSAGTLTGGKRPASVPLIFNKDDPATQQKIETARFFLSAHSRAPEVTLFGQPRVSIWPEMVTGNDLDGGDPLRRPRTAIDQLLAFCATISGNEYYFTRYDPASCTNDINISHNGVFRNVMLLQYLDYFTSLSVPGYGPGGVTFDTKYGQPGMRQILTEIFDYIRTINIADANVSAGSTLPESSLQTYSQSWLPTAPLYPSLPAGLYQVAPSVISSSAPYNCPLGWNTQGIGIYPRLNEIGIQFIAMGQGAGYDIPSSTATPAVLVNPVYGNTPSGGHGDSGPDIFGYGSTPATTFVGDYGTNPLKGTNPYVPDATNEFPDVNQVIQDTRQYFGPGQTNPNPNYLKWFVPGNVASGSTTTRAIQAFLLMSFTNPSQMLINNNNPAAPGLIFPAVWVEVSGLNTLRVKTNPAQVLGYPLGFPADSTMLFNGLQSNLNLGSWDTFNYINMFFSNLYGGRKYTVTPSAGTWASANPFYSKIIPLKLTVPLIQNDSTPNTFTFTGGQLTITLYDGGGWSSNAYNLSASPPAGLKAIQTYTINFGNNGTSTFTMPNFPPPLPPSNPNPYLVSVTAPVMGMSVGIYNPYVAPTAGNLGNPGDRWDLAVYPSWGSYFGWDSFLVGDGVKSMVLGDSSNPANVTWTDARMLATASVPVAAFTENPLWANSQLWPSPQFSQPFAHNFLFDEIPDYYESTVPPKDPAVKTTFPQLGKLNQNAKYWDPTQRIATTGSVPAVPPTLVNGVPNLSTGVANTDWDNGLGYLPDGPWVNKADEGTLGSTTSNPYFDIPDQLRTIGPALYSPNREIPSPGMFGSLPTGVDPTGANPTPWRTLLFRPFPGPADSTSKHLGWQSPKDHLLLDLFWMPVAEPYAISEPFSTAGKINLNYQIEPFTYITRSTAIRAVLNAEKIAAVNAVGTTTGPLASFFPFNGMAYKNGAGGNVAFTTPAHVRLPLDVNMTLTQFDDKFNGTTVPGVTTGTPAPDIFHSASQICEMYLVPQGSSSVSDFQTKWYNGVDYGLVGDNTRERPYTNIYGQITTKSNTYTVYYTVQSLKNADKDQTKWDENQGTVLGEYRGSTTLERYIDPNQTLPDFAATAATNPSSVVSLDGDPNNPSYYRWRVVDNHPFAP